MAKKEEKSKIVLERVYNVPLRREFNKVQNWRRTEKAVKALKQFVAKHMKSDNVVLTKYANKELWKHGIKNPPHHIKISAKKDDKGRVVVELAELPAKARREIEGQEKARKEAKKEEAKKEDVKKAGKEEKVVEAEFKEEKKEKEEKAKEIEKEEIRELKKEHPKGHHPHGHIAQPKHQIDQRPTAPKSL